LKGGAACRYKIVFPKEAVEGDVINVKVDKLENIVMYSIDTVKWSSPDYDETQPT